MANDFSKIEQKIADLKAKVVQNSITPQYLGAILDDLLKVLEQYDFRQQYKDSVDELKRQISELQQSVWPLDVELTVSPQTVEVGTPTTINSSWTVKRDGKNVLSQSTVTWKSGSVSETMASGASSKSTPLNPTSPSTTTITLEVKYDEMTKSATASVVAVYPSYFGKVAADGAVTADMVTGLTKILKASKAISQTGISLSNQRIVLAYPKSMGALTSVKDGNNFETLTAYTRTELTISGVAYYVYTMTAPVTASGIKQIYS